MVKFGETLRTPGPGVLGVLVIERTGNNNLYGRGWHFNMARARSGSWIELRTSSIIQKGDTTLVRTGEHLEINDNW